MSEPMFGELLVPFVCVRSVDGPYDDDSFSAGFHAGMLWAVMASMDPLDVEHATIRTALVRQVDLIAMHHGCTLTWSPTDYPEWTYVRIFKESTDG